MNKNRFFLIIEREYLSIVARKSFIVLTLLMPVLMVALGAVPALLAYFNNSDEAKQVAIVDETGKYSNAFTSDEQYQFEIVDQAKNGNPRELYDEKNGELYAIVIIPRDVDKTDQVLVYSESSVNATLMRTLENSMNRVLTDAKVQSYGIEGLDKILQECNVKVDVRSIKWSDNGNEETSSTDIAMAIGVLLSFLSYFFVIGYGGMIMNSVIEEKTNRIVEVIVSSCKPIELMLGKIIGVALVGLTQAVIWSVLLSIVGSVASLVMLGTTDLSAIASGSVASTSMAIENKGLIEALLSVNYVQILSFFLIYFVGGFLLYASIFAALGSAVDQASDASQFTTPVMLIIIIAMYAAVACMENPDGTIAFWCSMIPFTSPMVMMIRLPFNVPVWQMAASIAILFGSAIALAAVAAKIYRTGIMQYGKKPSYKDLIKWLK